MQDQVYICNQVKAGLVLYSKHCLVLIISELSLSGTSSLCFLVWNTSYMPVTLSKGRLRKTLSPQLTEWGNSSVDAQFPILGSIWLSNSQGNVSSGWPKQLLRSAAYLGQLPYCLIHFCWVLTQTPRNGNLDVMRSYWTLHVRKICTICHEWHLILVSQGGDSWMIMPLTCFFLHQKEEKRSKTGKSLAKHHSNL